MGFLAGPKMPSSPKPIPPPSPPPPLPVPPPPEKPQGQQDISDASNRQRIAAALATGREDTILTGESPFRGGGKGNRVLLGQA